ncbi:MAG: VOC family protein [Microscillaceae bacterium]|jgi:catechol 2,3-dioxygenase-like lactoylglutathione lyase family enzyme|nr:VOC family protein [Microscillaceae bacterium]
MKLNQITISVKDLALAISFYQKLGLHLIVKTEQYARLIVPGNEATFSLHLNSQMPSSETVIYFESDDLDNWVADLQQQGLQFRQLPIDQTWLWREAYLLDPSGNIICLYFAGQNRLNPPWRIN